MLSSSWMRVLRQALARKVCAGLGRMCKWETSAEFAMRSEIKYSLTEKCANCTSFFPVSLPSQSVSWTTDTNVEQAHSTLASAFEGRQLGSNREIPEISSSKSIVNTSASSSTRGGREDTVSH